MSLVQTVAPALEPVTAADVYANGRIIDTSLDGLITNILIPAARIYAEAYCGRSFITQQWRLVLDNWPYCEQRGLAGAAIDLERGPVQSIESIKYLDSGTLTTVASTVYVSDLTGPVPRVAPKFGQIWPPISTPQIGNVQVNYTAGYGATPASVPGGLRHWILMRVETLLENAEEIAVLQKGERLQELPYVDRLLDPYMVVLA